MIKVNKIISGKALSAIWKGTSGTLCMIVMTLFIMSTGCTKKESTEEIDFSNIENLHAQPLLVIQKAVHGKWKLYQTCGGFMGCSYPENLYITITPNEIITDTDNGDHSITSYSWKKKKVDVYGQTVNSYVLWPDGADRTAQVGRYFISVQNDTLLFKSCQLSSEESIFDFVSIRIN